MNVDEYIASKSLYMNSKNAVNGSQITILDVRLESNIGVEKTDALVAHWVEPDTKPLILNKTNTEKLSSMFGAESEAWKGCKVQISVEDANYMGKLTPCVRIKEALVQAEAVL